MALMLLMTRLIFFITLYSELKMCFCVCINNYDIIYLDHTSLLLLLLTTPISPPLFSHFDLMSQTVREHYWNIIIEGNLFNYY